MEHNILQNNAVDMYEIYYAELGSIPPVERSSCHTVNVYREQGSSRRPIRSLSWQADGARLASAHADVNFMRNARTPQFSYIWDIGRTKMSQITVFSSIASIKIIISVSSRKRKRSRVSYSSSSTSIGFAVQPSRSAYSCWWSDEWPSE